jgi:hypothetical protein
MVPKAVLTWVLMIPVAILNGIFRESVIRLRVGELHAHQLSVVTGSTGFIALVSALWRGEAGRMEDRDLFRMGAAWVVATILFEFGFGHYLRGVSWEALLHDYDVKAGRLWIVVLLVILFSPLLVKRMVSSR